MVIPEESSTKSTTISWKENISGIERVELAGSFSSWSPLPMTRSSCGIWSASVDIPCGRHEYKVLVDGDWRIDESVPSVGNDMGTENNVIHVDDEEVDKKETTSAESCSSRVDPQVEANTESRNDDVSNKSESLPKPTTTNPNTGTSSNSRQVNSLSSGRRTSTDKVEKLAKSTKPNCVKPTFTKNTIDNLLKVESKEENPLLMSPLTRGKLKKFTAENGSAAGNAVSKASGSAGKSGFKSSGNAGLKNSAGPMNATSKPSGSSRNPGFKPTEIAGSKHTGSSSTTGFKPLGSARNAGSKLSGSSNTSGSKPTGSAGSRPLGRAGNAGSKPMDSNGIVASKPLRSSTGNAISKSFGSTGNAASKFSDPKVNPHSAPQRVQAARGLLPKSSIVNKNQPVVNVPLVNNERSQLRKGSLVSGVQPQPSKANLAKNDKSRPAPVNSEKSQKVKRSLSNAENQIPNDKVTVGPPVFCRGRRGKF